MRCPQCQYEIRALLLRCPRCGHSLCVHCEQCGACKLKRNSHKHMAKERICSRKGK